MNQTFIVTKEHRRITEFANAVRKEKTIGICHGEYREKLYALANRSRTVFYAPEVLCRPKMLMDEINRYQVRIGGCIDAHIHRNDHPPA